MSETALPPSSLGDTLLSSTSPAALELLASKNATLRLRAPSGHVFSFTDLTSAGGLTNFGHLNPALDAETDLLTEVAADLAAGFYPPAAAAHAAWLCARLGLDGHSVLYRAGQQAGVWAAIATAQQARAGKILTIQGSTHGLAAFPFSTESITSIRPGAEFTGWHDVSCLLYEPIQTDAGYVPLPLPWLRGLTQAAQAAGVAVIADETEAGFYRFGKLSLAASEFLRPDIYLFGNSMTNGVFPLFAVVHPRALQVGRPGGGSAFQTAARGFAAAEAVARYIDTAGVDDQIAAVNHILNRAGEALAANPRLAAFHLAGPTLSLEVRSGRAAELAAACQAAAVLVGVCGAGHRIRIAPPITISKEQLGTALKAIEKAAAAL